MSCKNGCKESLLCGISSLNRSHSVEWNFPLIRLCVIFSEIFFLFYFHFSFIFLHLLLHLALLLLVVVFLLHTRVCVFFSFENWIWLYSRDLHKHKARATENAYSNASKRKWFSNDKVIKHVEHWIGFMERCSNLITF